MSENWYRFVKYIDKSIDFVIAKIIATLEYPLNVLCRKPFATKNYPEIYRNRHR